MNIKMRAIEDKFIERVSNVKWYHSVEKLKHKKKVRLQIYTHVYAFVCTSNSYCLISFSILSSKFRVIIYTGLFSFIVHQKTNIQTNVKNRNLSWKYDIKSSIPFEMLYQFLVDNGYQKSQKKEFHRNK